MKQLFLVAIIVVCSLNLFGQKDSTVKKDTSVYFLAGTIENFQLLYAAVNQPMDVTPNQVKALSAWIQRLQKVQPPPKEKPKK